MGSRVVAAAVGEMLLFLKARTSEGEAYSFGWVDLDALEFAHGEEAFFDVLELDEAHPFVFAVLFPFEVVYFAAIRNAEISYLLFILGVHHGHVEYLRGRVRVVRPSMTLTLILVHFLILIYLLQNQRFVMRIENLENCLSIVDLIFGPNCID